MMRIKSYLLLFIIFILPPPIFSEGLENSDWSYVSNPTKKICKDINTIKISSNEYPNKENIESLKNCDSISLYYGLEDKVDYAKARQCAFIHNNYDVLMMIYANGKQVTKNLDLALYFACKVNGAPAEIDGRINHLVILKKNPKLTENFNICDHTTSGAMMAWCATLAKRSQNKDDIFSLNLIKDKLTAAELISFQKIQSLSKAYFEARVTHEMEHMDSGSPAFAILEKMDLKRAMIKNLKSIAQCQIPYYTSEQYHKADIQLNNLYKKIQKDRTFHAYYGSNITKRGVKYTERSWIKYRNAFIRLSNLKCPQNNSESLNTIITNERIKQLKELLYED